jgi:hypothetical protein
VIEFLILISLRVGGIAEKAFKISCTSNIMSISILGARNNGDLGFFEGSRKLFFSGCPKIFQP